MSETMVNVNTNMIWECAKGHRWQSPMHTIHAGHWCKRCADDAMRKTIDDMHVLAARKNGRCLSTEYIQTDVKLEWQCKNGHRWWTTPAKVRNGAWCVQCYRDHRRANKGVKGNKKVSVLILV